METRVEAGIENLDHNLITIKMSVNHLNSDSSQGVFGILTKLTLMVYGHFTNVFLRIAIVFITTK